jgi:hypothetical protein
LPVGSDPESMVAAPDGALWFTELHEIGRITTDGMISQYSVPANGGPYGLTVGPDGALWFTESLNAKIGRITLAGLITEFPVPASFGDPNMITAGPDGALWFTAIIGFDIARAPACGLGLNASFANGTLTMNFSLGTAVAAQWFGNLTTSTGQKQLWSKAIPAVVPPASFTLTFGPGFPNLGEASIFSGLGTASGTGLCYETVDVNTASRESTATVQIPRQP